MLGWILDGLAPAAPPRPVPCIWRSSGITCCARLKHSGSSRSSEMKAGSARKVRGHRVRSTGARRCREVWQPILHLWRPPVPAPAGEWLDLGPCLIRQLWGRCCVVVSYFPSMWKAWLAAGSGTADWVGPKGHGIKIAWLARWRRRRQLELFFL